MEKSLWREVYLKHGKELRFFQSSPSASLKFFVEFLKKNGFKFRGSALDLGCGNGRNSIRLAKLGLNVYGVDIVKEALDEFRESAKNEGLLDKVKLFHQDMGEKLPFKNDFFEIAIDTNSFATLISKTKRERYKNELFRVIKEDGYYLIYTYYKDDCYYGPMLKTSPGKEKGTIISPDDKIKRKLYTVHELESFFSDKFGLVFSKKIVHRGKMFGKEYTRRLILLILQPKK